MSRFDGRTAVVTGGASGIGAAIVRRLAAEGARVLALDVNADGLERVAAEGGDAVSVRVTDVTVEDEVAAALADLGGLDALFNVAGGARLGRITELSLEDWSYTADLVLGGTFLCTKHAARAMRDSGRGGAIVNISSLNAHVPLYGGSAYAAAKAGVESFTKNAALELAEHGIRVNAILPGLIDTPMTAGFLGAPEVRRDFEARILSGRPATPDEVAGPALFLAGDDASYVNGTSLVVDAGWEVSNYPSLRSFV